jgi:DNA-binding transcriptional ArsR family regulator
MVELLNPQQRVRDLTSATRRIPIEIDGASSYEIPLTIWNVFNVKEGDNLDLGKEWLDKVKEATPEDLVEEIHTIGGPYCSVWLAILGLISVSPHPHDPDSVFAWIRGMNPERLRRWLLGYVGQEAAYANDTNPPSLSLIEQAACGDMEACKEIIGDSMGEEKTSHFITLFEIEPTDLRDRIATALERFRSEVFFEYEEEFGNAIARAAAARKAIVTGPDAKGVIEEVTNGLDYEIPLGVTRVILVPSVVLRPLSLIDRHREVLLVFYALADEFLNTNPDAPPSWMIRFYKALSDEKRLRILRRLSEGDTSLDELTDLLDLSKSTVHHHITILRAAGLIRVQIRGDKHGKESKCYGLRPQAINDASSFLESYMRPQEKSALA